ncbi:MAG: DUF1015 domain-containing protein [Spirochaetota bacterium]|nr:DUF1015 domain-containing protein [Spirochaetota bacterium]
MDKAIKKFEKIGVKIPRILMPRKDVDLGTWAVVACDQYTSEPEYWKKVEELASGSPSALNLILPECYLEEPGKDERINRINATMDTYLEEGVLVQHGPSIFLVQRETPDSPPRWGLILALDLEKYDFSEGATSLIRATEGTILDRIPPRKHIRRNAPIELPHILVLIDDPDRSVIEPLAERSSSFEKIYDFDLMQNSGHLRGYKITDDASLEGIADVLNELADPERFRERYGEDNVLLFAMGDGNHSLATAKSIWEDYKKEHADDPALMEHPCRWALVEIENIYDDGLIFEPIHRVVFNSDFASFKSQLEKLGTVTFQALESVESVIRMVASEPDRHTIGYADADKVGIFIVEHPDSTISAGTAQTAIDALVSEGSASVDYIHGADTAEKLGRREGNFGIFLPALDKSDFFRTVVKDGSLPRKTFSMGMAHEKRFYLEARRIR